jgi:N-acetylmuramoyl-L-alanine amidase
MQPTWIGCPSSNFRSGRHGYRPEAIVIHVMDGSFAAGESVFSDPNTQKSAHYGIAADGTTHQYVLENDTAFHAGIVVNPTWPLLKPGVNPNLYTIGIEHEGRADDIWPDAQLDASAALVQAIAARWAIPLDTDHFVRHHEIRQSKTCPGNWLVDLSTILSRIPSTPAATPTASSTIRTIKNVNLRQGRPNTSVPIARVIPANTDFAVVGYTEGERVQDNDWWYADPQGNFLWAGATNLPSPSAVG